MHEAASRHDQDPRAAFFQLSICSSHNEEGDQHLVDVSRRHLRIPLVLLNLAQETLGNSCLFRRQAQSNDAHGILWA